MGMCYAANMGLCKPSQYGPVQIIQTKTSVYYPNQRLCRLSEQQLVYIIPIMIMLLIPAKACGNYPTNERGNCPAKALCVVITQGDL
jgi:hypothetical protein